MKVEIKSRHEDDLEDYDYRDFCEVYIDDEKVFRVSDGESEDANLSRDFSDVWGIGKLMERAFNAGAHGEKFIICTEEQGSEAN